MSARPHTHPAHRLHRIDRAHRAHRAHRSRRLVVAAAAGLLLTSLAGCGEGTAEADQSATTSPSHAAAVVVEDPWVRATTGTEDPTMSAAFMVLDNNGDAEVTVSAASSPVAGRVELHEMAMVDGEMVMRESEDGFVLAPGRGQVLQPGGLHVMLMGLTQELAPGDEVGLTLVLDDGTEIHLTAPVKEFTEEEGHYHAPGTDPDHGHDDGEADRQEGAAGMSHRGDDGDGMPSDG